MAKFDIPLNINIHQIEVYKENQFTIGWVKDD
jgi:hypothetical protein